MRWQWIIAAVVTLVLLLALVVGLSQAQGPGLQEEVQPEELTLQNQQMGFVLVSQDDQEPGLANMAPGQQPTGVESVTALPSGLLNYQGQLLQNGNPYDGSIDITFRLYSVAAGGGAWWQETQTVQVDDGLFNVMLGAVSPLNEAAVYFSSQQWLGVQPAGAATELTPRQPLGVAAYAMNLMPGATMDDTNDGGPYGYSFWISSENHPALYAASDSGTAITAYAPSSGGDGVYGSTYGNDHSGVYGRGSGTGLASHGVEARMAGATGTCGSGDTECGAGLYATASGDAYGSFFYGENRSGTILVQEDNAYYGLWLNSLGAPDGYGIWTNGASSFSDYVTFGGGKSGYVVDIAINDGAEPLEKGDVVVISGYDTPVVGNIPVVRVQRATGANATSVIGVVDVLYVPCTAAPESLQAGQACGGFDAKVTIIKPGEYLSVVTLGAYEAIKVDATTGPIRPGDLLATSTATGYATRAAPLILEGVTFYAPGTVIGKAMGALDEGTGVIPVFVSSR